MFKYTKEIIINALENELDGVKVIGDERGVLLIKRGGEYKKAHILDGKIYKTKGRVGTKSVLTIDCDGLIAKVSDGAGSTTPEYGLYQLGIYLKMPNKYLGEYANANWQQFGRPILVGFDVNAAEANSATSLSEKLAKLLKVAMQADTKLGTVVAKDGKVVITLADPYMHFNVVKLERYDPTLCDSCLGEYVERDITAKVNIVNGTEPFATGGWIQENLRFPSYPNIRYASLNEEEYPVPGALYVQYSFGYESPRPGLGGLSGVGQKIEALTRHIYYVKEDLVGAFEAEIEKAFGKNVLVNYESVTIPEADSFSINATKPVKFTPQIYPVLEGAELEYSINPADKATVAITNGTTVTVTLANDAQVGDEFTVTLNVKGKNTICAPAVVKFTVKE